MSAAKTRDMIPTTGFRLSVDYNSCAPHRRRSVREKILRSVSAEGVFTFVVFVVAIVAVAGAMWKGHLPVQSAAQPSPAALKGSMVATNGS